MNAHGGLGRQLAWAGVGILTAGLVSSVVASTAAAAPAAPVAAVPSVTHVVGFSIVPVSVRLGGEAWSAVTVTPAAVRTVTVQYRRAGTAAFTSASSGRTNALGRMDVGLKPVAAGTWQFRLVVPATATAGPAVTATRTVVASGTAAKTAITGFSSSAATLQRGASLGDAVALTPRAARNVLVQYRRAGTAFFATQSAGVASAAGAFTAVYRPASVGVWQYRLVVRANISATSAASPLRTITAIDTIAPARVTGLHATVTDRSVALAWTNPADADFAAVVIRRATGANAPTSVTGGVAVATLLTPTASFIDTTVATDTQYSYAIFARDRMPNYAAAATLTVRTAPGPVTNLHTTTPTNPDTTINLSWNNPSDPSFTGVIIRRAIGPTPPATVTDGTQVADLVAPVASFSDTGRTPGIQYSYAVFAHDATPRYATPATVSATTTNTLAPGPVTNLDDPTLLYTSVQLTWTNPADADLTGVIIRRRDGATAPATPTEGTQVADLPASSVSFTDNTVVDGHQYSYGVFAHDGVPLYSAVAMVTVFTPGPATGLVRTTVTATTIGLAWTNPGDHNFIGVTIRRAVGATAPATPADGTAVAEIESPEGTVTDAGLSAATQYSYAVFAHDGNGNHARAANVTVTTADATNTGPPTAALAINQSTGATTSLTVGDTFAFDASRSVAADGAIPVSATLDYGDGSPLEVFGSADTSTWYSSHSYTSTGLKTVTLTVTDSAGNVDSSVVSVTVFDQPTASIGSTGNPAQVGVPFTFDLDAVTPPDTTVTSYQLIFSGAENFFDGDTTAPPATLSETFTEAGSYTVEFRFTNDAGADVSASLVFEVLP